MVDLLLSVEFFQEYDQVNAPYSTTLMIHVLLHEWMVLSQKLRIKVEKIQRNQTLFTSLEATYI